MRESRDVDRNREIISELKELIELCRHQGNACLESEKADLSKYRKYIKAITRDIKIIDYSKQKSNIPRHRTGRCK